MSSGARRFDPSIVLLAALIGLHLVIELGLLGADWGLWASPRLRQTAYEFGGFWPGLLQGWQPNYPGQGVVMFLTYGVLHGGPIHAIVNMITLWSLGRLVIEWVGGRGLMLVYLVALLGGALGYALLSTLPQPMVGASGALFGLAGALMVWAARDETDPVKARRLVIWIAGLAVAMNVAMWWALNGQIAWQTHLGGFLAGALCAVFLKPVAQ